MLGHHHRIARRGGCRSACLFASLGALLALSGCGEEPAPSPPAPPPVLTDDAPPVPPAPAPADPADAQALPDADERGRSAPAPQAAREPAGPPARLPAELESGTAPVISFERRFHDYGDIWDVGKYVSAFRFTNLGDAPLEILAVRAGCGCTTTSLSTYIYEPGESGAVDLVFSPQGMGRQVKSLTVVSDDPQNPTVELSIGANIREFAFAEPRVVRFPTVKLGESAMQRVLMRSADPQGEITAVRVTGLQPDALSARLIPGERVLSGREGIGVVEIIVHERNSWGAVYAMVEVTSHGTAPDGELIEHVARIACAASVFGSVHANDNMVRVEIVPPGGSFEKVIRVFSPDGRPFELSGEAQSNAMPIRVEVRPVAGQPERTAYDVFVRGDAGTFMGLIRGTLILRTDVPGEEELRMSIQGIVREV